MTSTGVKEMDDHYHDSAQLTSALIYEESEAYRVQFLAHTKKAQDELNAIQGNALVRSRNEEEPAHHTEEELVDLNPPLEEQGKPEVYRLELILGPMGAGKSSELGRRLRVKGLYRSIMAVTHSKDLRYGERGIITHDGIVIPAVRVSSLKELLSTPAYAAAQVIGIDEGQFFPELPEFIRNQLDISRKSFIISGLAGDKDRKPIGRLLELISDADDIDFLRANCKRCGDGTEAPFTIEIEVFDGQEKVGGMNDYEPVCRRHYDLLRCGQIMDKIKRTRPDLGISY